MKSSITGNYIHHWRAPIVVKVYGVDKHFYWAPIFNQKHLPVLRVEGFFHHWYNNHDGFWNDDAKPHDRGY